jgi:hypothetical protein
VFDGGIPPGLPGGDNIPGRDDTNEDAKVV